MKEFNVKKICEELVQLRGKESQVEFAKKLEIKRPTLSLLENGKQMPTIDILSRICTLSGKNTDEYFEDCITDSLVCLMGSLQENDKVKIEEMADIKKLVREKRIHEFYHYIKDYQKLVV